MVTVAIKEEPLSPISLYSECSQDGLIVSPAIRQLNFVQPPVAMDTGSMFDTKMEPEILLESPPLTPPRENNDFYTIPTTGMVTGALTTLSLPQGVQVKLPLSQAHAQLIGLKPTATQNSNMLNIVTPVSSNTTLGGAKTLRTHVVNSKMKIQPKPIAPLQPKTASPVPNGSSSKPLVLTAEEFAKLTAQGVLKFQPPSGDTKPVLSPALSPVTQKVATPRVNPSLTVHVPRLNSDVSPQIFLYLHTYINFSENIIWVWGEGITFLDHSRLLYFKIWEIGWTGKLNIKEVNPLESMVSHIYIHILMLIVILYILGIGLCVVSRYIDCINTLAIRYISYHYF